MKITPINNNNNYNPRFKGAFQILIPKAVFKEPENQKAAQMVFDELLRLTIKKIPRTFKEKLSHVFSFKPEAVAFFNFPGYSHISELVEKRGANWFSQHLMARYNIDLEIPAMDDTFYSFFLFTKKEKDAFLEKRKSIPQLSDDTCADIIVPLILSGKKMDVNDLKVVKKVSSFIWENRASGEVLNPEDGVCMAADSLVGLVQAIEHAVKS